MKLVIRKATGQVVMHHKGEVDVDASKFDVVDSTLTPEQERCLLENDRVFYKNGEYTLIDNPHKVRNLHRKKRQQFKERLEKGKLTHDELVDLIKYLSETL